MKNLIYKIRIYDIHWKQSYNEYGQLVSTPLDEDWKPFHLVINLIWVEITSFQSYILFDSENNPTEVTKVFLSDGREVFATNKFETFEKNFESEYLPLIDLLESKSED